MVSGAVLGFACLAAAAAVPAVLAAREPLPAGRGDVRHPRSSGPYGAEPFARVLPSRTEEGPGRVTGPAGPEPLGRAVPPLLALALLSVRARPAGRPRVRRAGGRGRPSRCARPGVPRAGRRGRPGRCRYRGRGPA